MNVFQMIGIGLAGAFVIGLVLGVSRGKIRRFTALAWALLWIAAAIAIARPEITKIIAQALGIARGADLVFYSAILAMFVGFFVVYIKLRRIDNTLTTIVRHIALDEGTTAPPPPERQREPIPRAQPEG